MTKTLAIDFDGVIHDYHKGWHDGTIYGELMPGAAEGIRALGREGYALYVHTARDDVAAVARWLNEHNLPAITVAEWVTEQPSEAPHRFWNQTGVLLVSGHKFPAVAYLDDRAVLFRGWHQVPDQLNGLDPCSLSFETADRILDGAPDSWDDDAAAEYIAVEYVRELERRLDAAGISREKHVEPQGHVIEIREDGWTIQHPIECRPDLFACAFNRAAMANATQVDALGKFLCHLDEGGALVVSDEVRDGQ